MPRPSSAEPAKTSKRKGTRSVSTLTPSQLARKRANDREAQRAIRARTREHIDRLEQELEVLKGVHGRDKTVQDLLRRNKALEEELNRLKENMGVSLNSSPYSAPAVYDDNLSTDSGAIPSPRMSPLPSNDYTCMPDYSQHPSSSSANDEFVGPAYIPTSMPTFMLPSGRHGAGLDGKTVKMEYEDLENTNGAGFRVNDVAIQAMTPTYMHQHQHHQQQPQPPQPQQQTQQQQDQWNMYGVYYPGLQRTGGNNSPCLSR